MNCDISQFMSVLVLGKGFVSDHLNYSKFTDKITTYEDICKIIDIYRPDTIINCIGKTGRPNIDQCELQKKETFFLNTTIPSLIAQACLEHSIHFINIGSGCIYYGDSPNFIDNKDTGWKETDFANPISYYSKSKYASDLILGDLDNTTVLRIRMPVSYINTERNFINKISKYDKLINILNSITFMEDFIDCIEWTINNKITGIYNVVNPQPLTAVDVIEEYNKYKKHNYTIITESELDNLVLAKRSNCFLNTEKLNKSGFFMTDSKIALEKCMKKYFGL